MDISAEPSIEIDEDCAVMDIVWRNSNESFAVVLTPGKVIGVRSTIDPPRSEVCWTVDLPSGLLTISSRPLTTP